MFKVNNKDMLNIVLFAGKPQGTSFTKQIMRLKKLFF